MDSVTFEALKCHFEQLLDNFNTILELKEAAQDDTCTEALMSVHCEVEGIEANLGVFREALKVQRAKLDNVKHMSGYLREKSDQLAHMVDNIPQRMPRPVWDRPAVSTENRPPSETSKCKLEVPATVTKSKPDVIGIKSTQDGAGGPHAPSVKQVNVYYPEIEFLTTDEFTLIPKYQKGRLTYDQINKFIEGMNKAYISKYKLLKQKRTKLNNANKKKYEDYKLQETKDTQGCYFIVDDDLHTLGGIKMDSVARSILSILRHCGRCREVRGGRLTRYVYIDNY